MVIAVGGACRVEYLCVLLCNVHAVLHQLSCWEPVFDNWGGVEGRGGVTWQEDQHAKRHTHVFNDIHPVPATWKLTLCICKQRRSAMHG